MSASLACVAARACQMDPECVDYQQCAVEQATEAAIRADERAKTAEEIAAEIERNAGLWEDYGQHPDGHRGCATSCLHRPRDRRQAVTRRKPLEWYDTDLGPMPDCGPCMDHMISTPHLHEAVASVAIEHPTSPGELMRLFISGYHDNRHQEA